MRADPVAVRRVGEPPLESWQVVLGAGILNVRQELAPLAHQMKPTPQEIARRSHRGRIDIRLRQQAAAQEACDLVRVDLVVLRLASVNRFHRQRVT